MLAPSPDINLGLPMKSFVGNDITCLQLPRNTCLAAVLMTMCAESNVWRQEEVGGPYGWATVHAHVREVAIHISNHSMRVGDHGMVVVGSSVELGAPSSSSHSLSTAGCH